MKAKPIPNNNNILFKIENETINSDMTFTLMCFNLLF